MFTPELSNAEEGYYVLVANHYLESDEAARLSIAYNLARIRHGSAHVPVGLDKCVLVYDIRGQNVSESVLNELQRAFHNTCELRIKNNGTSIHT